MPFGHAEELFHRALEIPAHERLAQLEAWCQGDAKLVGEVRSLLAGYETPPRFRATRRMHWIRG